MKCPPQKMGSKIPSRETFRITKSLNLFKKSEFTEVLIFFLVCHIVTNPIIETCHQEVNLVGVN